VVREANNIGKERVKKLQLMARRVSEKNKERNKLRRLVHLLSTSLSSKTLLLYRKLRERGKGNHRRSELNLTHPNHQTVVKMRSQKKYNSNNRWKQIR